MTNNKAMKKGSKPVNIWGNYNIDVPKLEEQNPTIPKLQNSESSQLHNSTITEFYNSESAKVQTFESPQVQPSKSLEDINSAISEVQTSEPSQLQNSESLQLQTSEIVNSNVKNNLKNGKKRKLSYKDMGWEQLTSYLSQRARKKLGDKSYREKRDISLILDELILNHL